MCILYVSVHQWEDHGGNSSVVSSRTSFTFRQSLFRTESQAVTSAVKVWWTCMFSEAVHQQMRPAVMQIWSFLDKNLAKGACSVLESQVASSPRRKQSAGGYKAEDRGLHRNLASFTVSLICLLHQSAYICRNRKKLVAHANSLKLHVFVASILSSSSSSIMGKNRTLWATF